MIHEQKRLGGLGTRRRCRSRPELKKTSAAAEFLMAALTLPVTKNGDLLERRLGSAAVQRAEEKKVPKRSVETETAVR